MKQIHFALDQEHTIDSLLFTKNLTQNTLYEYVEETIGSPVILSFDQQSVFDRNDTLLSTLFNIQSDVNVYCSLRLNLVVSIYLDGTLINVVKSDDSVIIEDVMIVQNQLLVSQLQPLILAECQLFDFNGNIIQSYVEVKQTFSTYVQGQEAVVLNLVTPKSVDPLQHLVVLKNISLWIDPDGQYVTFKFHNENMSGCLYKNKGKHPSTVALIVQNWITVNKIKYSIIDDYGFSVTWDDGTISQIHYY